MKRDVVALAAPDAIARLEAWFRDNGWRSFDFQREVWTAYLTGESGLVHSATGSGKTLAAALGPLAEWLEEEGESREAPPLRVLWITPMRALAADTVLSIRRAIEGLALPWTLGLRTGDTPSAERARQAKRLPSILVTTPESLSLMLASPDAREKLSHLRLAVVDEWHELLGNKRGVQTELGLARLRAFNPRMRTWGLSATLGNIDEALERLLGSAPASTGGRREASSRGRTVKGVSDKKVVVDTLIPPEIERMPWAGHLGLAMLHHVVAAIESSRSTLIFTNVRSAAEMWYQGLLEARPEWAGLIGLHHGSLDGDVRAWVEAGLKEGRLKAVVATSSLDLGVDFSPVERVMQIGSAKGVARLLQRAGRSGHAPGQVSRVTCVPSHALEFVEAAAARRAAMAGRIEARRPVDRPLDLLTQHLVTIAAGEGFEAEAMKAEVMTARAFRDLTDGEWQWALDFITRGGDALKAYPDYHKVVLDEDGRYRVKDAAIAKRHRMSIGTIVSDAAVDIRFRSGKRLGNVEESFIARLAKGDTFIFGGQLLEFMRMENMTAYVKPGRAGSALIPRWDGGKCPLSSEVADSMRELLELHVDGRESEPETKAVARLLKLQHKWSRVPRRREMLVEQTQTREGHHIFFYPFEGRQVHMGLSALLSYRLSKVRPATFSLSFTDYGFELVSRERFELIPLLKGGLLTMDHLLEDMLASLNAAELSKRQFREIARVAGLVFQGYPGQPKTNRQVQATSGLIWEVFARWDPANPLLGQAEREVLERQLEFSRLAEALRRMAATPVVLRQVHKPSPFAFPIMVGRFREKLTSEKLADRVRRMQVEFDEAEPPEDVAPGASSEASLQGELFG
ncbi:MAG TPA: ligase-associated DNA damage response DEXH box helicase [Usitatibacter sp.]|jgi:ATP-dependent Lhr-like helicase|nr:ligase-associated DNA damage response DEXH box helicase [Usitatibacter sp.]